MAAIRGPGDPALQRGLLVLTERLGKLISDELYTLCKRAGYREGSDDHHACYPTATASRVVGLRGDRVHQGAIGNGWGEHAVGRDAVRAKLPGGRSAR